MIAQSLILGPFWSHFGIILEVKIGSKFKCFLIDFPIDFLLILEVILGAVWYHFWVIC